MLLHLWIKQSCYYLCGYRDGSRGGTGGLDHPPLKYRKCNRFLQKQAIGYSGDVINCVDITVLFFPVWI